MKVSLAPVRKRPVNLRTVTRRVVGYRKKAVAIKRARSGFGGTSRRPYVRKSVYGKRAYSSTRRRGFIRKSFWRGKRYLGRYHRNLYRRY